MVCLLSFPFVFQCQLTVTNKTKDVKYSMKRNAKLCWTDNFLCLAHNISHLATESRTLAKNVLGQEWVKYKQFAQYSSM